MYSSYSYNYPGYYSSGSVDATVFGALAGFMLFAVLLSIAIGVLQIIAMWKIFVKAGEEGWKSIIPIYNLVVLYRISGISPLFVLIYLAAPIPFVGWCAILGITIYQAINLTKRFGKEGGFAVGLILLSTIFYMILGFGKSEYIGPKYQPNQPVAPPPAE